jgi:hypothetical protein
MLGEYTIRGGAAIFVVSGWMPFASWTSSVTLIAPGHVFFE